MLYLVIYDITIDSVRTKIAKLLIADGFERLQLSVFIGLSNPKYNLILWNQLTKLIKQDKNAKFYTIPTPKSSIKNLVSLGKIAFDVDYIIGEKNSLFL